MSLLKTPVEHNEGYIERDKKKIPGNAVDGDLTSIDEIVQRSNL